MGRENRLRLENPKLFPVQAFFNAISDTNFIQVIADLVRGVGHAINDADCTFPGDLDPGKERFEGVRFSLFEDEVIISDSALRSFIELACEVFIRSNPDRRDEIEMMLHGPHRV